MATIPAPAAPTSPRWLENRNILGLLFMLPAAVLLLLFLTYPLGLGVWLGFTDTKIGRAGAFIGLENYVNVFTKPRNVFWTEFMNSIRAVGSTPGVGMWHPIR